MDDLNSQTTNTTIDLHWTDTFHSNNDTPLQLSGEIDIQTEIE